jgi:hypothetical protein
LAGGVLIGPREAHRKTGKEGRVEGLRAGIEALCDALGIELTAERRGHLDALDAAGHEALLARLRAERRWA